MRGRVARGFIYGWKKAGCDVVSVLERLLVSAESHCTASAVQAWWYVGYAPLGYLMKVFLLFFYNFFSRDALLKV